MTVTATNFQDAPHSAWGFHHVRELLPTATVSRGEGPAWSLARREEGVGAIPVRLGDGRAATVAELSARPYVDGIAVLHDGALVFEAYGNGMQAQDTHILMSTTKSFAGSLAGILIDQGALTETDLVTRLVPELAGGAYEDATVRHLLDMRVGLDFSEDYDDPACDFAYMDAACGWRPPIRPGAPDNLADFLATMRGRPPHGGPFHYVSPNAVVLGWVLEAATGERFAGLLSRHLWQPMGAEFDADLVLDRHGRSQTEGGLNVALRDLARFGELHRLGGAVGGRQVVPAAWVEDLRANGDPQAWDQRHHGRAQSRPALSLHVVHRPSPSAPALLHGAAPSARASGSIRSPETVVARLSCFPDDQPARFDEMFRIFRAVADALHGE